jgi:hypothetical protein
VKATKQADGSWIVTTDPEDSQEPGSRYYRETFERYLNAFDAAFTRAGERSEFEFIACLLQVRGLQDAGWDPYKTTLRAITALVKIHETIQGTEPEPARHLRLWIYGHIVEAAEPYELLANLLDIAKGGRFYAERFRPVGGTATRLGRPQNPGRKIDQIAKIAEAVGFPGPRCRSEKSGIVNSATADFMPTIPFMAPNSGSFVRSASTRLKRNSDS